MSRLTGNKNPLKLWLQGICFSAVGDDYASSIIARCMRRTAFARFIRFFTEGFEKNVRFLNSFNTPERSYFFLKRRIARSMGSFSPIMIPTRSNSPPLGPLLT